MTALMIDTVSIQPYIFGSNKLKENIGGSFIIEELVYKKMIPHALSVTGMARDIDIYEWKNNPDHYKISERSDQRVEIGFFGGGNALLIFKEQEDAKAFVRCYSKLLLQFFPGLKTAYGFHFGFNYQKGEAYRQFRRELNDNLKRNRNFSFAQVLPFKHGIVDDCPWTNEAQEIKDSQSKSRISMMAKSRIDLVDRAKKHLSDIFSEEIGDKFTFTDNLEELGQPDDKGYVAVVHADGNNMGQHFMCCQSLSETRKLSSGVADFATEVMRKLIGHIVGHTKEFEDGGLKLEREEDVVKTILPIRPLILGGDDITFVCEGRLGVYLANKLLFYMRNTPIKQGDKSITISACAGVAIVKTKYPFYKAYQLSEELIKSAKNASREETGSSWLDYMISSGGFSGKLKDIIASQYTIHGVGELRNGPYRVDEKNETINELFNGMKELIYGSNTGGTKKWPRNKIKDLRDALRRDDAYRSYFMTEMKARGLSLPIGREELWKSSRTPFYDMIELLDFYPKNLLNNEL